MPGRFAEIRAFFDLKRKIDGHLQICPAEYLCCVFSTGSRPLQLDKVCVFCRFIYRLTTADSHQRCHLPPLRHRFMMYETYMEQIKEMCVLRFFCSLCSFCSSLEHNAHIERKERIFLVVGFRSAIVCQESAP